MVEAARFIEDLASRLPAPSRQSFVAKALAAVASPPPQSQGDGSIHGVIAPIWSQHFQPKSDSPLTWRTTGRQRDNKLLSGAAEES